MMQDIKWHRWYIPLSWKLWMGLLHPRNTPVFKHVMKQNQRHRLRWLHLILIMVGGVGLSYGIVRVTGFTKLEFPIVALVVLSIFSAIITAIWIVMIASAIAQEYQQGTYDLICIAPSGKMDADWSITTGALHRQEAFMWIETVRRWFSGITAFIFISVMIPITISTLYNHSTPSPDVILLLFEVLVFVILIYVEYVQSVLQGVLTAMILPRFIPRPAEGVIWAILTFILLQVILITVFLVGSITIRNMFLLNGWQYSSILPQLLFLFVMREACTYILWKLVSYQVNDETRVLQRI